MTECGHWSPRDLGPGWAHLCSVLKMAKTCLLDMKPFSTSRILRLSRGSIYFFSFSWWRKGRGQLWWTLPQGPWPTSNASHVARSPQMNLPAPSPPRSPDPATLASDSQHLKWASTPGPLHVECCPPPSTSTRFPLDLCAEGKACSNPTPNSPSTFRPGACPHMTQHTTHLAYRPGSLGPLNPGWGLLSGSLLTHRGYSKPASCDYTWIPTTK